MKQLELTSHVSDLWTRLDEMRSNHPLEEGHCSLCSRLFLLHWAEHLDTEQESRSRLRRSRLPACATSGSALVLVGAIFAVRSL